MNHSFADHSPGMSFKGAMSYYLNDRKEPGETAYRTSSNRVEWTSMRNLETDRAEVATAIMVATAKDANRLKQQAGIKATGRKAKTPVKTFALSWHPDEAASLNRAEMERAANGALKAIGMERHQAIIICHNDTRHPHVHVVVNRVSPEDGKLAKCGPNESRALDRWAYEYERDRGNIVSPNRAAKYERLDGLQARYSAEERRNHVRRKKSDKQRMSGRQDLRNRSKELNAKHKREWADLSTRYQARKACLSDQWKARFRNERRVYNAANKGQWKQYGRDKWRRMSEFDQLSGTFYGRLSLSIQAAQLQRASGDPAFKDVGLAKLTWINLRHPRLRNRTILALEKRELAAFKDWYNRPLKRRLERLEQARAQDYRDQYSQFQEERAGLISRQKQERNELQSRWRGEKRREERGAAQRQGHPYWDAESSLQSYRTPLKGNQMNEPPQTTEFMMKFPVQNRDVSGASVKEEKSRRDMQMEEQNQKLREATRKKGEQDRTVAKNEIEQSKNEQAKGRSRIAEANNKGRQQYTKENAAAKDRWTAEKRSLQDKSITQSKAKDALASLRSNRSNGGKRVSPDRER